MSHKHQMWVGPTELPRTRVGSAEGSLDWPFRVAGPSGEHVVWARNEGLHMHYAIVRAGSMRFCHPFSPALFFMVFKCAKKVGAGPHAGHVGYTSQVWDQRSWASNWAKATGQTPTRMCILAPPPPQHSLFKLHANKLQSLWGFGLGTTVSYRRQPTERSMSLEKVILPTNCTFRRPEKSFYRKDVLFSQRASYWERIVQRCETLVRGGQAGGTGGGARQGHPGAPTDRGRSNTDTQNAGATGTRANKEEGHSKAGEATRTAGTGNQNGADGRACAWEAATIKGMAWPTSPVATRCQWEWGVINSCGGYFARENFRHPRKSQSLHGLAPCHPTGAEVAIVSRGTAVPLSNTQGLGTHNVNTLFLFASPTVTDRGISMPPLPNMGPNSGLVEVQTTTSALVKGWGVQSSTWVMAETARPGAEAEPPFSTPLCCPGEAPVIHRRPMRQPWQHAHQCPFAGVGRGAHRALCETCAILDPLTAMAKVPAVTTHFPVPFALVHWVRSDLKSMRFR